MNFPDHMWLAGDGEGVVLVCNGPCLDTPAGDLVIAEYGETLLRRGVPRFELADLSGFMAFVESHGRSCKTVWAKDEPNWGPLEALLPAEQVGDWMWMGRVEHDGHSIEQYKHHETRRYINLSKDGQAWRVEYRSNDYCPPFCKAFDPPADPNHVCVPEVTTVHVAEVTLDEAFRHADVWPWSLNDPDHPRPSWMSTSTGGGR